MLSRRSATALALVAVVPIAAFGLIAPPPPSTPEPWPRFPPDRALARALAEAHANCEAARDMEEALEGTSRVLLDVAEELRAATEVDLPRDERARLLRAVRLIGDLGRALEEAPELARARLDEQRLTAEDARFLVGAVHVALARAAGVAGHHEGGAELYDPGRLRQFRGIALDRALEGFE